MNEKIEMNGKLPFFSVCIPVYNVEKYLTECMESVLSQSEKDFEIIVIDDGSVDQSGVICDEYQARYPNLIKVYHKKNEGLFLARLDAATRARGRYLLFLDSDDKYYPDSLRKIREAIETNQADLVIFDLMKFFEDGSTQQLTCSYENGQIFDAHNKDIICGDAISGVQVNSMCRKCVKRELYDIGEENRKYVGLVQAEDKFITLPCLNNANKIVYIKEPLYAYRANLNSVSYNYTLKEFKDLQTVAAREEIYMELWNIPEDVKMKQRTARQIKGVSCIISLLQRKKRGMATDEDVKGAIMYISQFWHEDVSFDICREALPKHYKKAVKYIYERDYKRIVRSCNIIYRAICIKRSINSVFKK